MPKVIQVIESEISRGGVPGDNNYRTVKQYHSPEGEFLAENDPENCPLTTSENVQAYVIAHLAKKYEMKRDLDVGKPPRKREDLFKDMSIDREKARIALLKSHKSRKTTGIKRNIATLKSGPVADAGKLLRKRRSHARTNNR